MNTTRQLHDLGQSLWLDNITRELLDNGGLRRYIDTFSISGDVPTLETLAAVAIMREHLPALKVRVVNVVDLMRLQPPSEHPHGLSDREFDALFTRDKPVIFAFHAYPSLIHRLPQTGAAGVALQQQLQRKLVEHKQYIDQHGQDLPEIRDWSWATATERSIQPELARWENEGGETLHEGADQHHVKGEPDSSSD